MAPKERRFPWSKPKHALGEAASSLESSEKLHDEAEEILAAAAAAEDEGDNQLAQALYEQGTEVLLRACKGDATPQLRDQLRARATYALDCAENVAGNRAPSNTKRSAPPPPLARASSAKLTQIAQIRAVTGDSHGDDALRLLLAKHGDNVEAVINELLEEFVNEELAEDADRTSGQHGGGGGPILWACPACTLENRMEELSCIACDQPRTVHQDAAVSRTYAAHPSPLVAESPSSRPLRKSRSRREVVPPRGPETLEEFVTSSMGGDVTMVMHLELPGGKTIQVTRALPAAQMRSQLVYLVGHETATSGPPGVVKEAWPGQDGNPQLSARPESAPMNPQPLPPRAQPRAGPSGATTPPPPVRSVGTGGKVLGGRDRFSVPSANQGAFGGEHTVPSLQNGLPEHGTRQAASKRGPAQAPLQDKISIGDLKQQLGDASLRQAIEAERAKQDRDDGNAPVNPDIRGDAPLYDDGPSGQFERSVFIDPNRRKRRPGTESVPLADQVRVTAPPRGADGSPETLPVAYEVAAVGSRLTNMARVGGQRVLEMDHFVESTATPIVRLVLPGASEPTDSRDAVLQARKVLERKLLRSHALAPTVELGGGAPPLRVLTALGDDAAVATSDAHIKRYAQLLWEVLVEVIENILQKPDARKATDLIASLYHMPTIRADVFVCSAVAEPGAPGDHLLHVNALCFQQSLSCDCEGDDLTKPLRVSPGKWQHLLPYWLCRIVAALNESRPGSATGLYDMEVRKRLIERVQARGGQGALPCSLQVKPSKWKPPPVPSHVLYTKGSGR